MSQKSIEEIARGTKTYQGMQQRRKERRQRQRPNPVLQVGCLYWATDVREAFGMQATTFAAWKQSGLETFQVPAGDLVTGAGVIKYLREHRQKNRRRAS